MNKSNKLIYFFITRAIQQIQVVCIGQGLVPEYFIRLNKYVNLSNLFIYALH